MNKKNLIIAILSGVIILLLIFMVLAFFSRVEPIGGQVMALDAQFIVNWLLQIFSLCVIIGVSGFLLYKPVLAMLKARRERISGQIDMAEKNLSESEELKLQYERKLKNIGQEREDILYEASRIVREKEKHIISEAKTEAEKLMIRAGVEIELEKAKARDEIREQIVMISTMLAERYISETIDEGIQNKLLDELIAEMGETGWRD